MNRAGLLDLNEALQHPGRTLWYEMSTELDQEEDLDLVSPVEGTLEAVSTGNLLLLKGRFAARAVFECSRCTAPIEQTIELDIEEQFPVEGVASSYGTQDFARVVPDEPYQLFEGNALIVDALIRQMLIVNLPLQPVCEYGWDGDCPEARERTVATHNEPGRLEFHRLKNLLEEGT